MGHIQSGTSTPMRGSLACPQVDFKRFIIFFLYLLLYSYLLCCCVSSKGPYGEGKESTRLEARVDF
jgi:hypothetical protein